MAYCCVPHCCSDSKKKLEGVSFHEIPADLELREAWIKVIRRDKWTPCTTSNYSRVCSQHFKEADFLEGKRRRLRKGVVPSVFQHYPLHLQPRNETPRSNASIRKRSLSSDAQKDGLPRKMRNQTRNETAPTPSSSALHETGNKSTLQSTADLTDHGLVKNTVPLRALALGSPTASETEDKLAPPHTADLPRQWSPRNAEPLYSSTQGCPTGVETEDESTSLGTTDFTENRSPPNLEEATMSEDQVTQPEVTVTAVTEKATQVDVRASNSLLIMERSKWKRKERDLKQQIERLRKTVDGYKEELQKLRDDCHVADLEYIRERCDEKNQPAMFLLEQIANFKRKKPSWSEDTIRHSIVLRHLSTKLYEHMRHEELLKLPSRNTLQNYLGTVNGETGFNSLVEARLKTEIEHLPAPQSKTCSVIVDEMRIQQKLQYNKQQDAFVGHTDMGLAEEADTEPVLANSLLCFVINGLASSCRIPVAYYFTNGLNGSQLSKLLVFVMTKVESTGFRVIRVVTDNHKVNVSAMKILCGGVLTYRIEHPCDPQRLLFLSFDYCHVVKNLRSQFLARSIGKDGKVSSSHLKKLYELQKKWLVKPVRFLSRKHVYPNNIEKMNVRRAVEVLSPDVTSALSYMKNQAGHCSDASFASAGPSIQFMENVYRWFTLHDTSNKTQHIHQNFPDTRHYDDPEDSRLEWLETTFPLYLEDLKNGASHPQQFLTKETHEALLLTTYSTVACIRHLLTEEKFFFVLTRKFSSDPVESLFGTLRRAVGCNDQLDVRSTLCGLEKILKTGIAAVSQESNVAHRDGPTQLHTLQAVQPQPAKEPLQLSRDATFVLGRLRISKVRQRLPTLQLSATVYVGGYIARIVAEKMACENCCAITTKPMSNQPVQQLTRYQDRGGLMYPSDDLMHVLDALREFVEIVLKDNPKLPKPMKTLLSYTVPALCSSPLLRCQADGEGEHRKQFAELVCTRFIRPLLVNYAFLQTDKHDVYKGFGKKPLSRKYVKL
ncbi:uncharacterized protein LOC120848163 [Ixodes scapularis]|uniref:uncharacterized protein LOC120848163 n=1 Tax=Ixodes scapularis TaxID=6945 RepID=UPI001A9FD09D|nr:uncharacterized protein LOC120848163 [Ixodes scapularis]